MLHFFERRCRIGILVVVALASTQCFGKIGEIADTVDLPATGREVGAACAFRSQCASQVCTASGFPETCGVCRSAAALGAPCDPSRGVGCSRSARCTGGVCRSEKGERGAPCVSLENCDDDLYCGIRTGERALACTDRLEIGAPCAQDERCRQGASCERGRCVLEVPGMRDNAGAGCLYGRCGRGLFCFDGICYQATLEKGAACGPTPLPRGAGCGPGTACNSLGSAGTCVDERNEGEPCLDNRCAPGLYCAPDTTVGNAPTVCRRRKGLGGACAISSLDSFETGCEPPLECRDGKCLAPCR